MATDELDLDERRLCPDGACIGIIGPDGRCRVCGCVEPGPPRAGASAARAQAAAEASLAAPDDAEEDAEEDAEDGDDGETDAAEAGDPDGPVSDFDDRVLCPDGACIGVLGPDGRCKICGKSGS